MTSDNVKTHFYADISKCSDPDWLLGIVYSIKIYDTDRAGTPEAGFPVERNYTSTLRSARRKARKMVGKAQRKGTADTHIEYIGTENL